MNFTDTSTAGSATITNNCDMAFTDTSTAGSATITNNGDLYFRQHQHGRQRRHHQWRLGPRISAISTGPLGDSKLTAGSIDGGGIFSLGQNELTVGGNNLSTTVTGVIADGGANGGTGGSLVKTGTGTLTLSGINTYTGATTVNGGTLVVNGSIAAIVSRPP